MKLYGSLNNRLSERSQYALPAVGDGATIYAYTDRYAATVVRVDGPNTPTFPRNGPRPVVWIVKDKPVRTDDHGMSEVQSYRFEPGDGAPEPVVWTGSGWQLARKTKTGKVSHATRQSGSYVRFGVRSEYYDYSF